MDRAGEERAHGYYKNYGGKAEHTPTTAKRCTTDEPPSLCTCSSVGSLPTHHARTHTASRGPTPRCLRTDSTHAPPPGGRGPTEALGTDSLRGEARAGCRRAMHPTVAEHARRVAVRSLARLRVQYRSLLGLTMSVWSNPSPSAQMGTPGTELLYLTAANDGSRQGRRLQPSRQAAPDRVDSNTSNPLTTCLRPQSQVQLRPPRCTRCAAPALPCFWLRPTPVAPLRRAR